MTRKTLIILSFLVSILFAVTGCNNTQNAPIVSDSGSFQAAAVNTWETKSLGGFTNVAVYTPSTTSPIGPSGKQSLLIVLHGCTQSYTAFKTANLETVASQYGMVIAAPDAMNKAGFQCWDYWGATKSRTSGDYKNLINLAQYFTANTNVDPAQVYIAGLSSGGAFAMTTGCLAPDIFAGMGLDAAPSTGTSSNGAFSFEGSISSTATNCKNYAGSYASHFNTQVTVTAAGTSDTTVPQAYAPQNAGAMASIYGNATGGTDATTSYGKEKFWTLNGKTLVSMVTLTGVSHAWPGGSGASGSYIDGSSINFGLYLAEFFKNNNRRISRDNIAPVVAITSPSNGASVSGTVTVAANATDETGVTKVEFYVNGVLKATDTAAPYSYSWDTSSLYTGTYTLVAKAYDEAGNTADSTVSVSVQGATDSVAPTVSVSAPTSGSSLNGTVAFTVNATDAQTGVAKVEFYVDGNKVGEDTTAPYAMDLDTTTLSDAAHSLSAKATDGAGNAATSSAVSVTVNQVVICHTEDATATATAHYLANRLDSAGYTKYGSEYGYIDTFTLYHLNTANGGAWVDVHDLPAGCSVGGGVVVVPDTTAPVVNVTAPLSNVEEGTITISADASDNVGVTQVAFYANGSLIGTDTSAPYSVSYTAAAGSLAVKAIASDAAGNTATDDDTSVTVTAVVVVPDTTAPVVNITSPANGATVSGSITIAAAASDNVGVTKVEFYINGFLASTDTSAPYQHVFDTTLASNNPHNLSVKAYDAAGNVGEDNDTQVIVNNQVSTTTTVSFDSISADDGYVKATSTGGSPAVGTYTTMAIGRGTDSKFNRAILSFDTSSLPDSANIVRAYVVITYSSKSGDPWANGNSLVVDVKNGTFGASATETSDWAATATANAVASIASFSSGTKQSVDFSAAGMSAISKTAKTQMKLRFATDQTSAAYIFIKQGADAKLYVEYQ